MIKKLKENFLILLISNMLTIIMVVVAPRIHGAIANLMVTVSDSDFGFSLPMIFYYISFAIIVCAFICLRKPQAVRDIVINNTVSSSEPSISDVEKAEEMYPITMIINFIIRNKESFQYAERRKTNNIQ